MRPWSQTMVSEGARPWGRGRSGDCEFLRVSQTIAAIPSFWAPPKGPSIAAKGSTGERGIALDSGVFRGTAL